MLDIPQRISQELSLGLRQTANALELLAAGATIPFIARYRKEKTGEMNEVQLRALAERFAYLTGLEERKAAILKSILEQGKLTDELRTRIELCLQKAELEDLYLPFKPKRRTRATSAREKGLEPLAFFLKSLNVPESPTVDLAAHARKYISRELGVPSAEEALQGASDILAEEVSEKAELRAYLRGHLLSEGVFTSRIKDEFPAGTTKFEIYRDYRSRVNEIAPHNMLALRRGEAEGILTLMIAFDQAAVSAYLESREIRTRSPAIRDFFRAMLADCFERLMQKTLVGDVRDVKKTEADLESIRTFEANLRNLLLASPAGMRPTLGIDPGFRTGCKVAALGPTGKLLHCQTIQPHKSEAEWLHAAATLKSMIEEHRIELIAIGNGTAGRETDEFVGQVLESIERKPIKVMVSEAGASVYSASEAAIEEFPEHDLTVRGAVSIGRRVQDPLAELVKIDPKSIGVGQYQHDVDQTLLKQKLNETVESCVNYVGVELNLASKELLRFVSGVSAAVAQNIVSFRNTRGPFRNRRALLTVPKFGPKAFEQAAGFLRIREGDNPLDNTAVHPESYPIVERIARDLGLSSSEISRVPEKRKSIEIGRYVTENVGEPTLRDILAELEKPGRDPRAEFRYASFKEGVHDISGLAPGMVLEGVVTNVVNFGAFVDIGVHQDGLVHVSELADRFVKDPKEVVRVGQIVTVRVLEVNEPLKRISLSMRKSEGPRKESRRTAASPSPAPRTPTIDDLKSKFNARRP
jgi:protein Tex